MLWLYSKTFLVSNSVKSYNSYTEFMVIIVVATGIILKCVSGLFHFPSLCHFLVEYNSFPLRHC